MPDKPPELAWCGSIKKHGSHPYTDPSNGQAYWCPGYEPIPHGR